MTDRLKGVCVTFDRDIRDDDAEFILNAIRAIKGVSSVSANITNAEDYMNRQRIMNDVKKRFLEFYDTLEIIK